MVTFDLDAPGAYINGFQSVESSNVTFSTENGNVVKVFEGTGINAGETDGLGLGGDGKFEPNAITLDFTCPVDFLTLDFGNDDSKPLPGPDLVPGVDFAVLSGFLGGDPVGMTIVVVNGNNLLDQSITLEGVVFDQAIFEYAKADGNLTNITSLTEVIDNVEFYCAILDADGDGVPDSEDDCPDSNQDPFVTIGPLIVNIDNFFVSDGCSLNDAIDQLIAESPEKDAFMDGMASLTNALKQTGLITGKEKGKITSAAAKLRF
jgi:hypothetical protein